MKLWLFGQSMSTPYGVEIEQCWAHLISKHLNIDYENFSQGGADNFYIYHSFLENLDSINSDDLVIIGWSHPSRKTFVFDAENLEHQKAMIDNLQYKTKTHTLFRKYNSHRKSSQSKWSSMLPNNTGHRFFDHWFNHYYSDHEQRCNFQAYLDSVQLRVPCQYIPFYFSKESVQNITKQNNNFMLEFTIDNNVALSCDDFHLNVAGHKLWADHLINQLGL
jgi:hypothetical protein